MCIVRIVNIKSNAMINQQGICEGCGKFCLIVNKKHSLCNSCNRKRLGREDKISQLKQAPLRRSTVVKKQGIKNKPRKSTGEREMFEEIWAERPHYCENCGSYLGEEPKVFFFAHEKGKGAHPELRLVKANVKLWCYTCHHLHDFGSREEFLKRKIE